MHYLREYRAEAVVEFMDLSTSKPIEFVIEHRAVGGCDVRVNVLAEIEFPIVPFMNNLKSLILDLDRRGALP